MSDLISIEKLSKDLKKASEKLTKQEVRYLVDAYYMVQDTRKRFGNQKRALAEAEEPNELHTWLFGEYMKLENEIKKALDVYSQFTYMGIWARSIFAIGPVIAAGLDAHIDIEKAHHVGHIYRFCGIAADQQFEWKKGTKRSWNPSLKTLCYKIGDCFIKNQNNQEDVYGQYYLKQKAIEKQKNEKGEFAELAKKYLNHFQFGENTKAIKYYKQGKLPPGHIHARARRYAVKLFLSHWHEVAYLNHYGEKPAKPYPIAHLGHADYIEPPKVS